jgi:hypothetical protein
MSASFVLAPSNGSAKPNLVIVLRLPLFGDEVEERRDPFGGFVQPG